MPKIIIENYQMKKKNKKREKEGRKPQSRD